MDIYIKWNNDTESIQLPVLPASFEVAGSQNNTSVNVHNLGEVNLKGKRNLFEISFSSFFPCQQYDFCKCEAMEPSYYVQTLQKILEDNTTVHVIITDTDCNFFCTLESFDYDMKEKTMDVGFNVSFKEYRVVNPVTTQATVKNKKVKKPRTKRTSKEVKSKSYTWKKGDTWNKVAKHQTGDSANGSALKKINQKLIDKLSLAYYKKTKTDKKIKMDDILVGQKVVIKV